jgi:mono/diheme cytochrome c family protein
MRARRSFLATAAALQLCLGACDTSGLPQRYRDVEVPAGRIASLEARARGRELFLEHCALCHGERADGRGRRRSWSVPPADFTDRAWRERIDPRRVYYVVREGVRGTPMPAWKVLADDEVWDLVAYVLSVADQGS